jgi:tetratricopeptide (TPR) repeat protein
MRGSLVGACFLAMTCRIAFADVIAECNQAPQPGVRVLACTEIIEGPSFGPNEKALAYESRGKTHRDGGAIRSALADFNEAVRLRPESGSAFAGRGWTNFLAGNWSDAIADYSEAIRLSPGSADYYIERGHVYIVTNRVDAAIADLTEAIRLNPQSYRAFNERGLAHFRKGDLVRAQEDINAAIAMFPAADFYANRGFVYEAQGRKQDAIDNFVLALLGDPSLVQVRNALKRLGTLPAIATETEKRVREGKTLAAKNCSGCHGVEASGFSPNKDAIEFRNIYRRHALFELRQPITRAVMATHHQMPQFQLSVEEMNAIVAYINSLSAVR